MLGLNLTLVTLALRSLYGTFNPASLFANGEQGVWYDPSDFSRYMQTGPETVSNGTFDTGTVGWTQALGSISAVGGRLRAARSADGASAGRAYTAIQCVPGKTYLFTVERYKAQTGGTTVRVGVLANGSSVGAVQLDTSTVDGFYRTTFVATQTEHYVILESGSGTSSQHAEFDNVSVKELTALESCTLFQDSAGTTPVTAVEQPVGLMLDKSKGATPGPELYSGGSITGVPIGGPAFSNYSLGITAIAGRTYKFSINVSGYAGTNTYSIGGTFGTDFVGATVAKTGDGLWVFTLIVLRDTALSIFTRSTNTANFSNISVKELPGNHAFQTTAIDRPVLSNRYNLLTKTEQFDDAIWVKSQLTVTPNATVAPDGTLTADLVDITIDNASSYTQQGISLPANTAYVFSVWVLKGTATGVAPSVRASGVVIASVTPVLQVGVWQQVSLAFTTTTANTYNFWIGRNGIGSTSLWGASLVPADQASLPYQRVNTATDYDADPSKFPLYLAANGTNTWMQTNSIDFTGTDKVAVFAGLRKLSDAAPGIPFELSITSFSNNGAFTLIAPPGAGSPSYRVALRGTATYIETSSSNSYPAPRSDVLSVSMLIPGPTRTSLRINGALAATNNSSAGTGNFGNYPLYLFRRAGSQFPFVGNFYGLVIRGALTNDAQIASMERWLSLKTGVTL